MWEIELRCEACGEVHRIFAQLDAAPRSFAYECPKTRERVVVRYRDPSRVVKPWTEVQGNSPDAIPTLAAAERGSFEL